METIKGWEIGYLSETFSFSCLSQVKLSVFKHHSPWFKVIAKVMIHKAGMVQPSAFRFLPSALPPQQDTINSSRSGEFNWNPLWVMRVQKHTFRGKKSNASLILLPLSFLNYVSVFLNLSPLFFCFSLLVPFPLCAFDSHLNRTEFLSPSLLLLSLFLCAPLLSYNQ